MWIMYILQLKLEWQKEESRQLTECVAEANNELEEVQSQLAQMEEDRDDWKRQFSQIKSTMDTTSTAELEMLKQKLQQQKV